MSGTSLQPPGRPARELTVVLIGRVGAGKSATGNAVLGRSAFRSCLSSTAVTRECQVESVALNGQNLTVVDTPGLSGPKSQQDQVLSEIRSSLSWAARGGPVVFLAVVQSGSFTPAERKMVKTIQSAFGPEAEHFTVALFTRGDDLRAAGRSVEELIGEDPAVKDFIRECRGGYHVLDNRDPDTSQVTELLQKIQNLVRRNGDQEGGRGDASTSHVDVREQITI
ncbi:GTPase IMAP family member 7-like [Clinocottus analis]|uniref:GTPase IMAP family member 7-like n=1 Tax=Clinocottus analis TaxID=304258 RepID=UPI0035C23CC5